MTAERNTSIPGTICGYSSERLLRAPCEGVFLPRHDIGDIVHAGEIVASVNGTNICAQSDKALAVTGGVLEALLHFLWHM